MKLLAEVRESETNEIRFLLNGDEGTPEKLTALKQVIARHPGRAPTKIHWTFATGAELLMKLPEGLTVRPSEEFVQAADKVFGRRVCAFR